MATLETQPRQDSEVEQKIPFVDEDSVFTELGNHMFAHSSVRGAADIICEYMDFRQCTWCEDNWCIGNVCEGCQYV